MEDLLVSRAFIAASEDPILGTSQKGKDFKKTMHETYKLLEPSIFHQAYHRAKAAGQCLEPFTKNFGPCLL
jgi:hypothetical protein